MLDTVTVEGSTITEIKITWLDALFEIRTIHKHTHTKKSVSCPVLETILQKSR